MPRVVILMSLLQLALLVYGLVHCIQAAEGGVRHLPKWAWILLMFFMPVAGPIAYFIAGRPLRAPGTVPPRRLKQAPRGPDDDPDFLRNLNVERERRERTDGDAAPGSEGGRPQG